MASIVSADPEESEYHHVPVNSMTGYPQTFIDQLNRRVATPPSQEEQPLDLLVLVALDNLPMIISGFGHHSCEHAVSGLIHYMQELDILGSAHTDIYRIQKDQIAILLSHPNMQAEMFTHRLGKHIIDYGYQSPCGTIHMLASLTSIHIPKGDEISAEELISKAYTSLKQGKAVETIALDTEPVESSKDRQDMNLFSHLTRSIKQGEFCMAYQPIIHSATGNIPYYEALLRTYRKDGTLASAGPMVPVAERMGLIDMIDHMVLDKIVEQLLAEPELRVSFNVSNLTANSDKWFEHFLHLARTYPDVISRMMIEITETAVHLDLRKTAYFVASLQAHGAKVALDDFGSGYTSFRQLKSLSVDVVKIDGIFVRNLVDSHDNLLFLKTMLDFTNSFGLESVAEFVENGEIAKMLMSLGVTYMQGYYFGAPQLRDFAHPADNAPPINHPMPQAD
jgi:EAL domain-containing protein (putative c-di-GMP-specific phosphodiesterase class I)